MGFSPGEMLQKGKYTIEKRLLWVGLTTVSYLAKRPSDESRWVIKVLDPQVLASLNDDERNRAEELFIQESTKLARCSGTPHIAKAGMPFKEGALWCLPVEYISGDSLADRRQPKLTEEAALNYIRQVGKALTVVHGQGLVHRDIRPSNIFLRIEGSSVDAVLTGFGLAIDCDTPLTRTRANELKDGFSPIELYASGRPVGAYSDVYSLAATLYELLTGVVPASANKRNNNARAFVLPRGINPQITEATAEAIALGMQLQAIDRPQSVADWLVELEGKGKVLPKAGKKPVDWGKWGVIWAAVGVFATIGMWAVDRMNAKPDQVIPVDADPATVQESPKSVETDSSEPDANSRDAEP